ncbi:MAG: REP-associated tyrosine transposase [Pseudomonas sp.]
MARSRYTITETEKPYFLTCTIVEWLPLFTRSALVDIVLDAWRFQQTNQGLKLYGYVVLENHLHYLAQSSDLAKSVASFKSFTARNIINHLEQTRAESTLQRLRFAKRSHKVDRVYQVWQEGSHAELVYSEAVMRQKLDYIHHNPVKRGYVDFAEHWRYSSARSYQGQPGLIDVQRWY